MGKAGQTTGPVFGSSSSIVGRAEMEGYYEHTSITKSFWDQKAIPDCALDDNKQKERDLSKEIHGSCVLEVVEDLPP
jgi:hypothetical protein